MVLKQFMQVLAAKGAVPFDAKGEKFDPALHEAMSQIPVADVEPEHSRRGVSEKAGCSTNGWSTGNGRCRL